MKPDAYLPFYGNDFFQAVEMQSDQIIVAYLRCIWNYWHATHCSGLVDDDIKLQRLCRIDSEEWELAKSIIFGELFTMEDGVWHQARAREEYEKASRNYAAKVRAAKASHITRRSNNE